MKKMILLAALVSVMFLGCKTTGDGNDDSPITTQEEANNALKKVYDEYKGDIILEGASNYSVKSGDTLSAISRRQYKNGYYFPLIMLASSDVVLDPDKIEPGMNLTVPDLDRNLNDPKARKSLKNFLVEIADIYDRRNRSQDANGLRDLSASL